MIAKLSKGAGFRGVLSYVEKNGKGELIGGSMSGQTPRELAAEFGQIRSQNQNCSRPVWHCSLSAPEGEKLSNEKWREIAADHMKNMNLDDHQYVVFRHSDTKHDHIHIVANRINPQTLRVASDKHDFKKLQQSMRQIEKNHGLQITASGRNVEHSGISGELKNKIQSAKRDSKTQDEFFKKLKENNVDYKLNIAKTGHISGISYRAAGSNAPWLKGSQLDASWQKINKSLQPAGLQAGEQIAAASKMADGILKNAAAGVLNKMPGLPGAGAVKIGVKIAKKINSASMKKRDRGLEM